MTNENVILAQVHAVLSSPPLMHTVTTTYYKVKINLTVIQKHVNVALD